MMENSRNQDSKDRATNIESDMSLLKQDDSRPDQKSILDNNVQ